MFISVDRFMIDGGVGVSGVIGVSTDSAHGGTVSGACIVDDVVIFYCSRMPPSCS